MKRYNRNPKWTFFK